MLLSTAEDIAKFVEELKKETDRGLPLVSAAFIDDRLLETLRSFFREAPSAVRLLDGGNAALGTLSSRADACHALGLIDEYEHTQISIIRKIRNEFAHAKHGISFQADRIQSLCLNLKSASDNQGDQLVGDGRSRFMGAVLTIVLRLYHRPDWMALERCRSKDWDQLSPAIKQAWENGLLLLTVPDQEV